MAKVPVIKTVNLSKEFELGAINVQALSSVNIEIYSGEFIIFFGPSGCGKSTLMSMVAGLQPPSKGEILIRGEELSKYNQDQLADYRRTKIGMVFQAFNLIRTMNVVENIALPLAFARIQRNRRMARAENLLEVVGMGEYKKHTPAELSGGQQQRIAIARSLVANPWIIMADEPTGNLDSKSANEVMRLLISLNRKSKRTIVLITHNPEYLDYADRIFFLKDGHVVDVKVNSKVKKIDEVESVGKIRDDLNPEAKSADLEEMSKKLVAERAQDNAPSESSGVEEEPVKGKKKAKKTKKEQPAEDNTAVSDVSSETATQEKDESKDVEEKTEQTESPQESESTLSTIKLG
jgi:putative ABC transport system ATP-binding protein